MPTMMPAIYCQVSLWLCALCVATAARADITVIVNSANPVQSLTTRQVAELYLGRTRAFQSGEFAVVIDRGHNDPLRSQFFKDISGMSIGQVNAFWSRLRFTGQVQPPQIIDNDAAVVAFVASTPAAIGYVSTTSAGETKVKIALVLRD